MTETIILPPEFFLILAIVLISSSVIGAIKLKKDGAPLFVGVIIGYLTGLVFFFIVSVDVYGLMRVLGYLT